MENTTEDHRVDERLAALIAAAPPLIDLSLSAMRDHARESKKPWNDRPRDWLQLDRNPAEAADLDRPIRRYSLPDLPSARPVLWIHGGGWSICTIDTHHAVFAELCRIARRPVFAVHPRQAPEHPYPAPMEDVADAIRALSSRYPQGFHLAGDSAGANLALGALLSLGDAGQIHTVRSLSLVFGCYRAAFTTHSHRTCGSGEFGLSTDKMRVFWQNYLGGTNGPYADLSQARFTALPPVQIQAAELDPLRDDSLWLADRLAEAGDEAEYHLWPGMTHGYIHYLPDLPQAMDTLHRIAGFFERAEA